LTGADLRDIISPEMTTRERFNKVFRWEKPDRVPDMEFGYWDKTIAVWHEQGLPRECRTNRDVERHLGLEGLETIPEAPVHRGLFPEFEERTLERRGEHRIVQTREGALTEMLDYDSSMPHFIKFAVETRADWEKLRDERLDPDAPGRAGDVAAAVEAAHADGRPILFHCGSLYGWLRDWMGLENLSVALMTDRAWVEEMMEHLTLMDLALIERHIPGGGAIDVAWWWEDMCYNHGPLMSPRLFEELMVPRYKRVTDALKAKGVFVNVLDCDGRIYDLVPGWLRGGINVMFPIEAAHTDPLKLRADYGTDVLLLGGVDKRALIAGGEAIDRELEKLRPLVERGGFLPCVDHRVPPDVTYANYLAYLEKKKAIL
jgi:uroporphyrinogen decarboxylase